jgi:hypothetical protein
MILDIEHQWGGDLGTGSTGDLAVTTGSTAVTQRLLRRLLTNPGDYIWNLTYGAGLPGFVGAPTRTKEIEAVVRSQMALEAAIARVPQPVIDVSNQVSTEMGAFQIDIRYADALTGTQNVMSIPVSA